MVQITPFGTVTPVMGKLEHHRAWRHRHGGNAQAECPRFWRRPITPAFGYAAFATNNGCAALSFTGNGTTDSYDSGAAAASGRSGHTAGDIQ